MASSSSPSVDSELDRGASGYADLLGGWPALAFGSKGDSSALSCDSESGDSRASESMDVEGVPTTAASGPKCYVQPTLERPKVMPSDHAELVHDWSAWPKFPATKNKADRKQRVAAPKPRVLPLIKHFNSHEFLPEMELQTSSEGVHMHPAPSFRFTNLADECQYTAWLTFTDVDGVTCQGQYQHPESPRPGSSWNGKVISFDRVRLCGEDGGSRRPGHISLKTGMRCRVQVNVGCVNDCGYILSATVARQFIGTTFVVVRKRSSAGRGKRPK
ncbi:hypothetical protein HPB52_017728 [Rhipicephalus sanguineus]|uniref:T-box domain-containing protein n=1 Tax=Rhipicephalus sanguineus TaxID=34632 RepID=A0A9D4SUV0_RHISA|nr:hypothetical protein HPB52_017728 [Rhipicephalus sanguineus]